MQISEKILPNDKNIIYQFANNFGKNFQSLNFVMNRPNYVVILSKKLYLKN